MHSPNFNRPPRLRPRWSSELVDLPAPPTPPHRERTAWLPLLAPVFGALMIAAATTLGGGNLWIVALPAGTMAVFGIIVALDSQHRALHKSRVEYAERQAFYEDQLDAQCSRLHRLHEHEATARRQLDPAPSELLEMAGAAGAGHSPMPRLWERRPGDDDFLALRVGCGSLPASSGARLPALSSDGPVDRRLQRIAAEYAHLRQVPIGIPLRSLGSLGVAGPRDSALALLHAMIWQAAVLHAPSDLRIAAIFAAERAADWEWLRWLPHCVPLSNDLAPSQRMLAGEPEAAAHLLSELLDLHGRRRERTTHGEQVGQIALPQLLLVIDGTEPTQANSAVGEILRYGAHTGIATLVLVRAWPFVPEDCAAIVELSERGARWARAGDQWPREPFTPDCVEPAPGSRLARHLAGIRLLEAGGNQSIPRSIRLFDLLDLTGGTEPAVSDRWAKPPTTAWHPDVPIGVMAEGKPLYLDLNEGRHGPHGIIAGATGAGKSVLLQTIIVALAATHAPSRLQLLLVDFKGGAALAMFESLPHTAGLVTDLEGRMAERAMTTIKSELRRRKALLKRSAMTYGLKVEHIGDYRALAERHNLDALPNLLIVVDEFDEMARGYPDFVSDLVRVVKQGRSLGIYLLLATQQPSRAVSDEIRSQLSYFLALRLGSSDDSREMILKPDAAFLPADIPGRAYMRVGGELRMFQAASVTGAYHPTHEPDQVSPRVSFVRGRREYQLTPDPQATTVTATAPSDLEVLVRILQAAGRQAAIPAPIWQPPLASRISLGELTGPDATGIRWDLLCATDWMRCKLGRLDIPQESIQIPFTLDIAAAHLAVVGAPGSGKTMLLRSLVLDLALSHSPRDLWCYLVDAGGQGLSPLAGLPHVAAMIQVRERERVRRLLRLLDYTIRERQDRFRGADASDLPAYRAMTGERLPALLLVIDKLAVLREEFRDGRDDAILDELVRLARLGRPYGVYLVISADRASDLSYRLLSLLEARIALRLPELADYPDVIGTRVSVAIPANLPGRALWSHQSYGPLELQVALPTIETLDTVGIDDETSTPTCAIDTELIADLRESVSRIAAAWQLRPEAADHCPQPVVLLPEQIRLSELATPIPQADALLAAIGRESLSLSPAMLCLNAEAPHALVIGGRRSGKSTALQTVVCSLAAQSGPDDLELLILDSPRRSLERLCTLDLPAYYAHDAERAGELARRLSEPRRTRRRLLVIDDYTLCREQFRDQLSQIYSGEPNLYELLNNTAQLGGAEGVHLLIAASLSYPDDSLLRNLDGGRNGLVLWPGRYDPGTRLLGVGLPLADQRDAEQPPGRALLIREDEQQLIQVARS